MNSGHVWAVVVLVTLLLGFVGYHFTVRTLRFFTTVIAVALVVLITRHGVTHPVTPPGGKHPAPAPTDLVNAFTRGARELSAAFFQPLLLGHRIPVPGRIGWLVLIVGLVFGYRELEVWAMRWQPPNLDMSALRGGQPTTLNNGAASGPPEHNSDSGSGAYKTARQLHNVLVAELRFRLPAVDVRAPAILPGGATTTGLASIIENSGVEGSGLAGAILRFVGALWPNPRRYQVRVWLEHKKNSPTTGRRVTVDLEDARSGGSIATKTLPVREFDEASSVVAGYVARHIFKEDPTAPPWCVGSYDGSDLAAMLFAGQQKIYPESPSVVNDYLCKQIRILENCNSLAAGVARYELAHLYDLKGDHVKALLLHALGREHFPRFYRGRYRLGMSLEMIANPHFKLTDKQEQDDLRESLRILDRSGVTQGAQEIYDAANKCDAAGAHSPAGANLSCNRLRKELLAAAKKELHICRRQLSLPHVVWGTFRRRDERVMRKPYWRLRDRQHFHDGALVAELLVTVRQILNNEECTRRDYRHAKRAIRITGAVTGYRTAIERLSTWSELPGLTEYEKINHIATLIKDALTGGRVTIRKEKPASQGLECRRWLPWQRRTQSWPAAYNTACVYAALADSGLYVQEEMAERVVTGLTRAINDPGCELERPWDWISQDPDFSRLKESPGKFKEFLCAQKDKDYPAVMCRPKPNDHQATRYAGQLTRL